jgi:hypothetical protein
MVQKVEESNYFSLRGGRGIPAVGKSFRLKGRRANFLSNEDIK